MNKIEALNDNEVNELFIDIKDLIERSRNKVYKTINIEMINLYWNIGKIIVKKQNGNKRAKYGDYLLESLSKQLTENYGKGFSTRNLKRMRKLYLCYQKETTDLSQLTWSHYLELIKISDEKKRDFYMHECINSNWDVKELQRKRTTCLYERLASSREKNKSVGIVYWCYRE